jgi:type VI secretion system protein ImpC
VRDKIGSFKERSDMQIWLQRWIMNYVDGDPAHSPRPRKRRSRSPLLKCRSKKSRESGLLLGEVLSAPALPAGRIDGVVAVVSKLPSPKAG